MIDLQSEILDVCDGLDPCKGFGVAHQHWQRAELSRMPRANFVAYKDSFPPKKEALLFSFKLFSLYFRIRLLASDPHTTSHNVFSFVVFRGPSGLSLFRLRQIKIMRQILCEVDFCVTSEKSIIHLTCANTLRISLCNTMSKI
jgi:hypothetical protein